MSAAPALSSSPELAHTGRVRVGSYVARDATTRAIEIAYDVFGRRGRPLVLIMGIGAQRMFWDHRFCELLVAQGFQVVRFDHRDIGESTQLDVAVPSPFEMLARRLIGATIAAPYSLSDLAADVVGLIDGLGFADAHLVGVSLGGMVGQHAAIEHGARVRSLTAIATTPGARRYLPEPRALGVLFRPMPNDAEEAGRQSEHVFRTIGSPAWPVDGPRLRALGAAAYARGMNPRGFLRQFSAVLASGDRRPRLPEVRVPTLVIHGSRDPMFPLAAGRALAELVPHSTWLPVAGMGHDLPVPLWPMFARAIARHAERAETGFRDR